MTLNQLIAGLIPIALGLGWIVIMKFVEARKGK